MFSCEFAGLMVGPYYDPPQTCVGVCADRKCFDNHPKISSRKAYPNIGRALTVADIGKKILRVYPYEFSKKAYDWSFTPFDENKTSSPLTLVALNKTDIICKHLFLNHDFKINWVDSHWLTLEEWIAFPNKDKASKELPLDPPSNTHPFKLKHKSNKSTIRDLLGSFRSIPRSHGGYIHHFPIQPTVRKIRKKVESSPFNQVWYAHIKQHLPITFLLTDYAYHRPVRNFTSADRCDDRPVDLHSQDPRTLLGLGPNVRDIALIKKQYRKLALLYHPDKNPHSRISEEEFKKINKAYNALLNVLENNPFISGHSSLADDDFAMTNFAYAHLVKESESNKELTDEEILKKWDQFILELEKTCKKHFDSQMIKLILERILLKANSFKRLYQIKIRLNDFKFPERSDSLEQIAQVLAGYMKQIKTLKREFDLNNIHDSWPAETLSCGFKMANKRVEDKYTAFARSAAEIYAKLNKPELAMELRDQVSAFANDNEEGIFFGILNATVDHFLFSSKLKKHIHQTEDEEMEKPSSSKTERARSQSQPNSSKAKQPPQAHESNDMQIDTIPEETEQEALVKNIENNNKFFHLLSLNKKDFIYE